MHIFLCITIICATAFQAVGSDCVSYNLIEGLPNILICTESERIGCTWRNGVVYDKPLIQKFFALLSADTHITVLDIGAQTGAFSLMAAFLPHTTWYAFEPIQEVVEVLIKNLTLNNITQVEVYPVALTDHCGTARLAMPDKAQWGLATIGSNVRRFKPQSTREVPCIDLDTFIAQHGIQKVDFMKVDTEGAELLILHGGKQLLMRDHPIILMEYSERNMKQCNINKQDVNNFLTAMGYTWQFVSAEDILCTPSSR